MISRPLLACLTGALLALAACATVPPPAPIAPAEIVAMAKSGMPAADILQKLQASRTVYALPASELARLRDQGVPDAVIDYMQATQIEAARREEYRRGMWDSGGPWGPWGPWGRYPWGWRYW